MAEQNHLQNADDQAQARVACHYPHGQATINHDGSGHTVNVNGTLGAVLLGIIALVLLRALLQSEARCRELLAQLAGSKAQP